MIRTLLLVLALGLLAPAARASSFLDGAGPLWWIGAGPCAADFQARLAGACDPPAVLGSLSLPEQSRAHVDRAVALIGLFRMGAARAALDDALLADRTNASAWLLRARLDSNAAGSKVEETLRNGLAVAPNHPGLLGTAAFVADIQDRHGDARELIERALRGSPRHPELLFIRSQILLHGGDLRGAVDDLTGVVALGWEPGRSLVERARILVLLGRTGEAMDDLDAAISADARNLRARDLRANLRESRGDLAGSLEDLTAVLGEVGQPRIAPGSKDTTRMTLARASLLARLDRVDSAVADVQQLLAVGGKQLILKLQLHLRRNGYPDVPVDGKPSPILEQALKSCFSQPFCGASMTTSL